MEISSYYGDGRQQIKIRAKNASCEADHRRQSNKGS